MAVEAREKLSTTRKQLVGVEIRRIVRFERRRSFLSHRGGPRMA